MAASRKDTSKKVRRVQEMMAAGIEDDVVASTVVGDIRGSRYPHILNHVSSYTIPSIDEVLNHYHEPSSPYDLLADPEPIYPDSSKSGTLPLYQEQREDSPNRLVDSNTHGYAGQEVIGPGYQLYNLRYAYPPGLSPENSNESISSAARDDSGLPVYRCDYSESTSSSSESDDPLHLTTILEEPEPPELEADIDIVKPTFKSRRRKEISDARKRNRKRHE